MNSKKIFITFQTTISARDLNDEKKEQRKAVVMDKVSYSFLLQTIDLFRSAVSSRTLPSSTRKTKTTRRSSSGRLMFSQRQKPTTNEKSIDLEEGLCSQSNLDNSEYL